MNRWPVKRPRREWVRWRAATRARAPPAAVGDLAKGSRGRRRRRTPARRLDRDAKPTGLPGLAPLRSQQTKYPRGDRPNK